MATWMSGVDIVSMCHRYKYCMLSNQLPSSLTTLPVQTDDKWLAMTYNSLPECGGKQLHKKACIAMVPMVWSQVHSKGSHSCDMCKAGEPS